jgi:DNA-binding MarR family transcriptional regulator
MRRAGYGLNQAFRRRIAHLKITPDQFTVLRTLREHDGISQRQLARLMASDPNTIASLLERMERNTLVRRMPHPTDRRAHQLHISAGGRRTYETARQIAVTLQTEVLKVLPAGHREPFLEHLALIADACQEAAMPRTPRA